MKDETKTPGEGVVLTFHHRKVTVDKLIVPSWGQLPSGPVQADNVQAHAWMLDVLGDLRSYAKAQGLDSLAGVLTDCGDVALEELRLRVPAGQDAAPQNGDPQAGDDT